MSETSNANVSVVVLTKNSARTLDQCLISVIQEHPGEVIDVDSMSTDETLGILRRYGVKVEKDTSCSLGRARQTGVSSAKSKYIMFVDSDVQLTKDCIRTLVHELEKNGWAAVQAKLISKENLSYWQNVDFWLNEAFPHSDFGPQTSIATAATVFKRELLLNLQFDPNFVEAAEDIDICFRLVRAGHIVGISRNAIVYHNNRREFLPFFRQQIRYGRGNARLAYKYRSPKIALAALHYTAIHLIKSLAAGRWSRVPFFVTVMVGNFIGTSTFRVKQRSA